MKKTPLNIKVLYEDNHVIAVFKPAGVLTQGDSSGRTSLYDMVKDYLKEKYNKPGNVYLGLVHRLDKPVSGIVLFGKTSKGASRLSAQFREHTIQKTYHAIVLGKPNEEEQTLKQTVNKISFFVQGYSEKSDEELLAEIKKATKTRTAELSYQIAMTNGKYSLLKVLPRTGRFHQIRIQMAKMGCPILGDNKYANSIDRAKFKGTWPHQNRIALSATGITFKTATEEKEVKLEIPLPEDWNAFVK
jgi:23S rRNA pseudouridine1911/1915/1917 synthase